MQTAMQTDGTKIRIETPVPPAARLFGVPFLALGLYVAWNLLMSVAAVMNGQVTADQAGGGQFLTAVFLLASGVPGAALVFGQRFLVIDRAGPGSAGETRKLGFFRLRTATVPLAPAKLVRAARQTDAGLAGAILKAAGRDPGPSYEVVLIDGAGFKMFVAAAYGTAEEAARFGKKLALTLSLPFENQTVSEPDEEQAVVTP